MEPAFLYLFIRTDLSPEVQAIQSAHATFEFGLDLKREDNPDVTWFTYIGIDSERELIDLKKQLSREGIPHHAFYEPDYNTGYTALAAGPLRGEARLRFKDYQLYRRPRCPFGKLVRWLRGS